MRFRKLIAPAVLLVGSSVAALAAFGAGNTIPANRSSPAGAPGSSTQFAALVHQTSNRCALQARAILAYPAGKHLQGSCCTKMDATSYRAQVRALRRYRSLPEIPRDPYDVPAGVAQRLLRYDESIALSPSQRGIYARAMSMSDEKGPCCCKCWRWNAFRGLSKYLISHRGWRAPQLASLIGALDGCGGKSDLASGAPRASA